LKRSDNVDGAALSEMEFVASLETGTAGEMATKICTPLPPSTEKCE